LSLSPINSDRLPPLLVFFTNNIFGNVSYLGLPLPMSHHQQYLPPRRLLVKNTNKGGPLILAAAKNTQLVYVIGIES
jgi:hypothetical protein